MSWGGEKWEDALDDEESDFLPVDPETGEMMTREAVDNLNNFLSSQENYFLKDLLVNLKLMLAGLENPDTTDEVLTGLTDTELGSLPDEESLKKVLEFRIKMIEDVLLRA